MWHVGFLYRMGDILEILETNPSTFSEIVLDFPKYGGVEIERILELSLRGGWIKTDNDGKLILTKHGHKFLMIRDPVCRLRSQIFKLVDILSPTWTVAMIQGRKAFAQYAPPEVAQCFRESGILESFDEEVITWWDKACARFREDRQVRNMEIGRKGERLSYAYEYNRTGEAPYWISIEYEGAGYDLKSKLSQEINEQLLIEVKTSNQPWESAKFYLSKYEWKILSSEPYSVLHLWSLATFPQKHSVIPIDDVAPHIPRNRGEGVWESIECPFNAFSKGYC